MNTVFKTRSAAIILMAAGYGWAGGHYIPSNSDLTAYLFQIALVGAILLAGVAFLSNSETIKGKRNWAITSLNILSFAFFVINIANIIHGFFNTNPNSFGSHNTFADLVPIVIILVGSALWILTLFTKRRV
jgi:predicted acyltransferase